MNSMRVRKSLFNSISNALILVIRSVLLFAVRIVLVKTLGRTLLGVDSLFTNVLLVLSIADSGISTAISFYLYKPLSDKKYDRVSILLSFYKKVYHILGLIVFIIGLLFIPFLRFIITESVENIYLYYLIYLATTVVTYFISYKECLLIADQNQYKSSFIVGITYILMYVFRIVFLILVPMLGDRILAILGKYEMLDSILNELLVIYHVLKWPLTFIIIFLDVRLIYSVAPSKKLENHSTTVGALITTVLWVGFTAIFGSYIKYFARYDLLYGSLSSIIIFLIWIYTLSIILIFGIVVNSTLYSRSN